MRPILNRPAGQLVVHEIYASIQGESTYVGLPCIFIRLTGCPLRCRWCDTPHAFTEGKPLSIEQILDEVDRLSPRLVEVTGGEPLAHPECDRLLSALADTGRQILLETSGAISIESVDSRVIAIVDMKCPSSGECGSNDYENLRRLRSHDEVKFVVGNREDFDWSVELIRQFALDSRTVLFSPVHGELDSRDLADWILSTELTIRQQVPLHKVIWGADARGV
ncbi:radical SAM protein [bacterium]|nr:radical SAM protein [bacterium]